VISIICETVQNHEIHEFFWAAVIRAQLFWKSDSMQPHFNLLTVDFGLQKF